MLSETKSRSAGKKLRIGINGFGRIGRVAARILLKRGDLELVAINSRADANSHAYLLSHDSTYGNFNTNVTVEGENLIIEGKEIAVLNNQAPEEIPWSKYGVDIVIDSSGKFRKNADLKGHLNLGAKYVVLSSPAKDQTKTYVMGVNNNSFDPEKDKIVSNSSCTTNCLSTIVKVLNYNFGIEKAFMTTTHSLTDSQNLLDNSHKKEKRLSRSAVASLIPASTGSAKDIVKLFPALSGKIVCQAIRVPTTTVSMINLVANLSKKTSKEEIDSVYKKAANGDLKGIVTVAKEELVSIDYKGSPFSSIYDPFLTSVIGENFVNLYAWYDNEWGYATRLVDLVSFIGKKANI